MALRNEQIQLFQEIMKEAGALLLSFWNKPDLKVWQKGKSVASEADIAIEQFLIKRLSALGITTNFCAEESGISGQSSDGYQWVIDPVDGTRNFVRHIPYFCISVALTHHDDPIVGAIYNPLSDELFFAQKGQRATCNGVPLYVAERPLSEMLVVTRLATDLTAHVGAVRHMGAIALDMAYLAAGRLDAVIFSYPSWWDIAAGQLLLQEAGGQLRVLGAQESFKRGVGGIAGAPAVIDQLGKIVKSSR